MTHTKIYKEKRIKTNPRILALWQEQFLNALKVKVTQSCLTLCDAMDHTVYGILQARILEWIAFPFSRESSQPRDRTQVSCIESGFFTTVLPAESPGKVIIKKPVNLKFLNYFLFWKIKNIAFIFNDSSFIAVLNLNTNIFPTLCLGLRKM